MAQQTNTFARNIHVDVPLKGCASTFKFEGFKAVTAVVGAPPSDGIEAAGKTDDAAPAAATAAAEVTVANDLDAESAEAEAEGADNPAATAANDGFLALAEFCRDNESVAIGKESNAIFTCSAAKSMGESDDMLGSDTKPDSRAAVSS